MIILFRENDQVYAVTEEHDRIPVKILRARIATGSEISITGPDSEIAFVENISELDEGTQRIIREELTDGYFIPRIIRVIKTEVFLGNRYFHVDTDCGERSFIVKNPYVDVRRTGEDSLMIRDVIGNRFKISPLSSLDSHSIKELEKVI